MTDSRSNPADVISPIPDKATVFAEIARHCRESDTTLYKFSETVTRDRKVAARVRDGKPVLFDTVRALFNAALESRPDAGLGAPGGW